jgi:hypothetical protein
MDITADNLLNQVAQTFFDKIDKQDLDPKFFNDFLKQVLKKITTGIGSSTAIPQNKAASDTNSFILLKKTYIELLKDGSIRREAQNFFKTVFDKQLVTNLFPQNIPKKEEDLKEVKTDNIKNLSIKGIEKLKDIKVLGLEKLKDIKILGTEKLKDIKITGADNFKNILAKSIEKINKIKILGIEKLKDIKILGIEKLKDIKILGTEKLKDIKVLNIEKPQKIAQPTVKTDDTKNVGDGNRPSLIEKEEKPKKVIIVGITENAAKFLKEGLGGMFKGFLDKLSKSLKDLFPKQGGGLGLLGGGLALLLGGLAALVSGLMTDGPFKGLLKILAKLGLPAAMKALEAGAKLFIGNLKLVFELIGNTFKDAAKFIGRLFGRNVYRTLLQIGKNISTTVTSLLTNLTESVTSVFKRVRGFFTSIFDNLLTFAKGIGTTILEKVTEVFGKVAGKSVIGRVIGNVGSVFATLGGKLFKIISPVLKRIPGIGTIISWGFAYTRFKSGDTIGGIIDILSGIATLFPGIGTVIGIGLDVLNAFLDYKTGGATAEASVKKGNIAKEWLNNAWNYWKEKILNIPLIKNIIETGEAFAGGDWASALTKFIRLIPNAGWILDWMGMTEDKSVETLNQSFDALTSFWTWVKESVFGKIGSMISGVIDWSKEKLSGIMSTVSNFWPFNKDTELELPKTDKTITTPAQQTKQTPVPAKMEKGGVIPPGYPNDTFPALLTSGEAVLPKIENVTSKLSTTGTNESSPEVISLDKYLNKTDSGLNNSTLENIAGNTKDTNTSLKTLGEAIFKLVTVIDKKLTMQQSSPTIIGMGSKQNNIPSAATIANSNFDPIRAVRAQFI